MTTLTAEAASDLFRNDPDHYLGMGAGKGEVAVRTVGSGPDVLFVHGWPVHGATFRLLLPHLVEHVTCHVVDLPGAGSSRYDTNTDLSIANHVTSVRRSVELLELDSVAVVGHDSGGMIARHAMTGNDRLRAMGLINTEPSGGVGWRFRSFIADAISPDSAVVSGGSLASRSCDATSSCWAMRSRTARSSTANSTSSSCVGCTPMWRTARR